MRDIRCRGKLKSDDVTISKRWAYGYYCKVAGKHYIILDDAELSEDVICAPELTGFVEVNPATVGQQTGLKDKKRTKKYPEGQDIYEGDIVEVMPPTFSDKLGLGIVYYSEKLAQYLVERPNNKSCPWALVGDAFEVIGNVHDTPELLEEQK